MVVSQKKCGENSSVKLMCKVRKGVASNIEHARSSTSTFTSASTPVPTLLFLLSCSYSYSYSYDHDGSTEGGPHSWSNKQHGACGSGSPGGAACNGNRPATHFGFEVPGVFLLPTRGRLRASIAKRMVPEFRASSRNLSYFGGRSVGDFVRDVFGGV